MTSGNPRRVQRNSFTMLLPPFAERLLLSERYIIPSVKTTKNNSIILHAGAKVVGETRIFPVIQGEFR
jgi:hypothetical protein